MLAGPGNLGTGPLLNVIGGVSAGADALPDWGTRARCTRSPDGSPIVAASAARRTATLVPAIATRASGANDIGAVARTGPWRRLIGVGARLTAPSASD